MPYFSLIKSSLLSAHQRRSPSALFSLSGGCIQREPQRNGPNGFNHDGVVVVAVSFEFIG